MDINGSKNNQNSSGRPAQAPSPRTTSPAANNLSDTDDPDSPYPPSQNSGRPPFKFDQNRGKTRRVILGILVTLLLLGLAAAAAYFYWQQEQAQNRRAAAETARDEQAAEIKKLKEAAAKRPNQPAAAAAKPDGELAVESAKAYAAAKVDADVAPKVEKLKDGFALVSLPLPNAPTKVLLKKAPNGLWVVLNDTPTTALTPAQRSAYKVPADL